MAELPQAAGIEHDPEVYAAVKKLALKTVDAAIEILDTAAPAQQLQMIRVVLPRFTGGLSQKAGDGHDELRGRVEEMFGAVAAALDTDTVDPEEPNAPDD